MARDSVREGPVDGREVTIAPEFALAIIVALMGAAGSFFAVKFGGQETQRLVKALHKRFDDIEHDVKSVKEVQARHDERIKALKESQQFTLRRRLANFEAQAEGQPPMFRDDETE